MPPIAKSTTPCTATPRRGDDYLVIGHESFGIVEEVGPNVKRVKPGDYVTATVRRPGGSIYDLIGTNDMTSEETYYERGINLRHGYLTEYFVDEEEYIVRVPHGLKHLHVLMEPMSCAAKAVHQAYEAQRRMRVWRPQRAFVMGVGQIGLFTALILRLRGIEVYCFARSAKRHAQQPDRRSDRVPLRQHHRKRRSKNSSPRSRQGRPDHRRHRQQPDRLRRHAGPRPQRRRSSGPASPAATASTKFPADKINIDWVLGNKLLLGSVNANREHFEMGIRDLALGEMMFPGVIQRILTHPVNGLDNYQEMMRLLVRGKNGTEGVCQRRQRVANRCFRLTRPSSARKN